MKGSLSSVFEIPPLQMLLPPFPSYMIYMNLFIVPKKHECNDELLLQSF